MLDRKAKSLKHEQSRMVLKITAEPTLFSTLTKYRGHTVYF
jgi:hypothetical protein